MKKMYFLIGCLIVLLSSSCQWHNGVDITVSEDEEVFKMTAHYYPEKTKQVHEFLDKYFLDKTNFSFTNSYIDERITLNDHTTFYLKTRPGNFGIRFEKTKNTSQSYEEVKKMCDEVKNIIAQ
ncbi:MAG: hypothetical protein ACTHJ5_15275 [Ilyomonas sp.]